MAALISQTGSEALIHDSIISGRRIAQSRSYVFTSGPKVGIVYILALGQNLWVSFWATVMSISWRSLWSALGPPTSCWNLLCLSSSQCCTRVIDKMLFRVEHISYITLNRLSHLRISERLLVNIYLKLPVWQVLSLHSRLDINTQRKPHRGEKQNQVCISSSKPNKASPKQRQK